MMPRECENARPLSSWYRKLCTAARRQSSSRMASGHYTIDLDLGGLDLAELVLHEALEVLVHELEHEEELAVLLQAVEQTAIGTLRQHNRMLS
jgi:hypothetical protein